MTILAVALENNESLVALYGNSLNFSNVNLHELRLDWNGPTAHILLSMDTLPAQPPAEWAGCDIVLIELTLSLVMDVNITRFARGNACKIVVDRLYTGFSVIRIVGETNAVIKGKAVRVEKVTPCRRGT